MAQRINIRGGEGQKELHLSFRVEDPLPGDSNSVVEGLNKILADGFRAMWVPNGGNQRLTSRRDLKALERHKP